jgi:hypothetical protein
MSALDQKPPAMSALPQTAAAKADNPNWRRQSVLSSSPKSKLDKKRETAARQSLLHRLQWYAVCGIFWRNGT